jgi:hypothetical protein
MTDWGKTIKKIIIGHEITILTTQMSLQLDEIELKEMFGSHY